MELGATVSILDVDSKTCAERIRHLEKLKINSARAICCDLANEAATRRAARTAIRQAGRLDILIHCAALVGSTRIPGWAVPFDEQTVKAWDTALRVNLTSAFVLARESRKALANSGHGSIILIGSIYGVVGPDFGLYRGTSMANPAGYAASKGGLLQLMRYLAALFAPKMRVNMVSPGGVWRRQPDVFHRRYKSKVPLGRMATEEDLKGAVYLAAICPLMYGPQSVGRRRMDTW